MDTAQDPLDSSRMAVWEHLGELRTIIIRCLIAIAIGFAIIWNFAEPIIRFLEQPLLQVLPEGQKFLYFTGIADKFFTYLKVTFLSSIIVTFPFLLQQFWRFLSPGLYPSERKWALPFVVIGCIAFLLGLAFAYTVVIPYGYAFLVGFGSSDERPIITLNEYFSLTLKLLFGMGIIFEVPVAFVILAKAGLLTSETLTRYRKQAFLANAVLAAVITPTPDAFTMMLVLGPLILLYELGILGVKWVTRVEAA